MSVRNSIVHRLFVENSAMRITLDRATIWRFAVENSQLTLDCSAASTVELTLGSAHLAISGALREIKQNWTNTALTDSQVVRDFEIRLVGPSGEPVSNVTVDLEAPSREVSQHTSDVDGILHISIAFDDTNHGSEWILRIRGDAKAVVVPVYLLRSTPLRVVVP